MSDRPAPAARAKARVRPYPWGALDAVTRADAEASRALHRAAAALGHAEGVAQALSLLLEARVEILVRRVRETAKAPRGEDGIGVLVGASDAPDVAKGIFVEVEPALGTALVARAMRRTAPRLIAPGTTGEALAGAVAAVVLATARRVHASPAPRILATGPARDLARDLAAASGTLLEASLTVLVNDDAFAARLLVPRALALALPAPRWTRARLLALGEVPLGLAIVAAVSESTAATVGSLRRGDAWIPGGWPLRITSSGRLAGPVLLAAGGGEVGFRALLGEDGRLVAGGERTSLPWTPAAGDGDRMQKEAHVGEIEKDALVDAVGEIPVVVRVEIGTAEMRAREWASLAPGDVVSLGRKVGEAVTLRVGGITVARGELVDLDGEVGVRILGRSNDTEDR